MKEINLTQGKVALVDDEDFKVLNEFKWYAHKSKNTFYAERKGEVDGKQKTIKMHQVIMGGKGIDHRDGNGCNNTKTNLRLCTNQENLMNTRKQVNVSSIYKGVYWNKPASKWHSRIMINGKSIHLGYFSTEVEAAKAYNNKAMSIFCEFANLNKC